MHASYHFLSIHIPDVVWLWLLIIGIPLLLLLAIIMSIANALKRRKARRQQVKLQEAEKNWANPEGIAFFQRLAKMINQNESQRMSDHAELQGMAEINQASLNQRFMVNDPKFGLRMWYVVSVLHDRYEMERRVLVGKEAHVVEREEGINLGDREVMYEKFENVEWFELRRSRQRSFGYQGLGIRIPLVAGIAYRAGQIQRVEPQTKTEFQTEGKGTLYVTNQRIMFIGRNENKVIALDSILDLEQYMDAVLIGKARGKKPLIRLEMDDAALFSRLVMRLFQNN